MPRGRQPRHRSRAMFAFAISWLRNPLERLPGVSQRRVSAQRKLIFGACRGAIAAGLGEPAELQMRDRERRVDRESFAEGLDGGCSLAAGLRDEAAREPAVER